jgi:hypothetical protein
MSSEVPVPDSSLQPSRQHSAFPKQVFLLDLDHKRYGEGARPPMALNFNAAVVLLLLSMFAISLGMIISSAQSLNLVHQLHESGAVIQGEITAHRRNAAGTMNQGQFHYVTYQFQYPDGGKLYRREQFVSKALYEQLQDGTSVTIKVLPSMPTLSTLTGDNVDRGLGSVDYITLILGVIGLTIASVYLVPRLPRWWVETQMLRRGQIINGQLLHCRRFVTDTAHTLDPNEYGAALSSNFFIEVAYRFQTPNGKEIKGIATNKRNDLHRSKLPNFGTPIVVLYLDDENYEML